MTDLSVPLLGALAWIDVVLLIWFAATAISVVYVAYDAFTKNPEMTVMKWGWVLVTAYLGLVGLVLYIMSCKEPGPRLARRVRKAPLEARFGFRRALCCG